MARDYCVLYRFLLAAVPFPQPRLYLFGRPFASEKEVCQYEQCPFFAISHLAEQELHAWREACFGDFHFVVNEFSRSYLSPFEAPSLPGILLCLGQRALLC